MQDLFNPTSKDYKPTPKEQLRYTRWENLERYKKHQAILAGFRGLCSYLSDIEAQDLGIDKSILQTARKQYVHQHLQTSKTFTVCPTCYEALRNRKPRKSTKSTISEYPCNICDKPSINSFTYQNRKIRHTSTLAEANTYVRITYPELFI